MEPVLETLDNLAESLHEFYKKGSDGKYYLQIKGNDGNMLENVDGMKRAKEHESEARKAAEKTAADLQAKLDEINAKREDDIKKAKEEAEKAARAAGDVDALEKSWDEKYKKLENTSQATEKHLQGLLQNATVDATATNIASELALKGSASVLKPHITKRLAMDITGETPKTIVLDKDGNRSALTLDELKDEFRSNEAFAPLLVGSQATGSGANGSDSTGGGAPQHKSKRSDMTSAEKVAYIGEHGQDEFLKLPE